MTPPAHECTPECGPWTHVLCQRCNREVARVRYRHKPEAVAEHEIVCPVSVLGKWPMREAKA